MISRVWKRHETLFGVDRSKKFGVSSVLDLFREGNDVLQILMEKIYVRRRAWKSKSNLRILAAWGLQKFKGPSFMCVFFYIYIYIYIYAYMHLCIDASMRLCIYLFIDLAIYLSVNVSSAARSAADDSNIYIVTYIYSIPAYIHIPIDKTDET